MGAKLDYNEVRPENKWKILRTQWRFGIWAIYTSLGPMMGGFDFVAGALLVSMPAFQQQYGIPFPTLPSGYLIPAVWQSGWIGAATGGSAIGCIVAGLLMNHTGRKPLIWIGCVLNFVGIGMQQASSEWKLFLIARLIHGIGFAMTYTFSPVWIGEMARPEVRGLFLCFFNCSIVFGQFLIVLAAKGSSQIVGKWSYELLIDLQYIFPVILFVFSFWFPESAYYLIKKGRLEDARKALNRTHGSGDQSLIDAEMRRLEENVRFSEEILKEAAHGGPLIYQCFRGNNLPRTLTAMLASGSQQLIGAAFFVGYITYFLELIGVTAYFTVSCVMYAVSLVSNLAAFPLIEIMGRRTLIIPGMALLTLFCLVMGIAGTVPITNTTAQWVIVVFIFLWDLVYQVSIGACGLALPAEIGSLPLRSHTQAITGFVQVGLGWVVSFVIPYIINPDAGNLGGKIGYIFFGFGVIVTILLFFYCPETKGLNYDEIDYLFTTKTNPRKFQETIKKYRAEQRVGIAAHLNDKSTISENVSDTEGSGN